MNPETMYPELKEMKDSEMFIEWAYITKPSGYLKIHIKTVINKKSRDIFVKALKQEHNVVDDEEIQLITIYR